MPRVHGIDLVPRRGRRRSGPLGSGSGGLRSNDNDEVTSANKNDDSNADPAASSVGDGAEAPSLTVTTDQVVNNAASNVDENSRNDHDNDVANNNELGEVCGSTNQMTLKDTTISAAAQSLPTNNEQDNIQCVKESTLQSPTSLPVAAAAMNHQSTGAQDQND